MFIKVRQPITLYIDRMDWRAGHFITTKIILGLIDLSRSDQQRFVLCCYTFVSGDSWKILVTSFSKGHS